MGTCPGARRGDWLREGRARIGGEAPNRREKRRMNAGRAEGSPCPGRRSQLAARVRGMEPPQPPPGAAHAWGAAGAEEAAVPGAVPAWGGREAGLGEAAARGAAVPGVGAAPPARARKPRRLSPLWEEAPELAEPAGAARGGEREALSPEPPLFRSFFAEECLAIARQLGRPGPELSGIEAEPLPLEAAWSLLGGRPGPRAECEAARRAEALLCWSPAGSEPGRRQQVRQQDGGGLRDRDRDRERGGQSHGATVEVLPAGAGGAVPGKGAEDAEQRRLPGLQALALSALNLTVELQGPGHASASLRQMTFEISAANPLGSTVTLPVERERLAEQSSFKDSEADDLERSGSAYRTQELEMVSNESTVSLGSSSFATSTPLMGPAKFHFVTGSPLGEDLEQRDPNSSRRSMPRELTCPRQAGCKSAAPKVTQSSLSKCRNLPEETCGKVTLKPPQRSTALPVSSRNCSSAEGQAAIKSLPLAFTTPRASRSLALTSFESRRASRELLRAGLPPRSRGITLEGKATRLSLGNSRPSMQKAAATRKTSQGSNVETQPAAQLPASSTVKRSATKLPCSDKCPSSLRPPAKLPGRSSSSRPLLMGSQVSLGPGILCMSKEAGAPGTKLPTHPGTRLRLMKPRPSSVEHTSGTLQPACSLPSGYPGARSSPQDKETESVAKLSCNKLPVRRAATATIPARAPHSRLRPTGRTTASPKRLPSPKRARLGKDTNSAAAAQAVEPSGGKVLSADTEDKPALAVGQDLPSAGEMAQPQAGGNSPASLSSFLPDSALESRGAAPSMQLPGQLLSQELQRVRSELQRVKNELAARDAQCEAYQRTISSLEAQLRAGSLSEGWGEKQACALEGE
ncbi:uncharacterized protein LOC119861887 [Dermochelys coriacea]|uniref:uncharacterized protein LOC119861887 n=1 Tax=Dermochelys coriacea TaxID=27794 RepID=UPI001CA7D371|nr:uncharacterized protein LOC119861887 [Dermochelys coriacea]